MLIRSQSKSAIINIDNVSCVEVRDINGGAVIVIEAFNYSLNIAEYSTKEKAIKVLDMIQEAYAEYKITCTFLTGFTGHRAIVESDNVCVNGFEELVKAFKKNMVFQMPEDSEVEV